MKTIFDQIKDKLNANKQTESAQPQEDHVCTVIYVDFKLKYITHKIDLITKK
jgi:hypothetical protein